MTPTAWAAFAAFWVVFVLSPGPNAVNCVANGMAYGLRRGLWGVAAIVVQAALYLMLAAAGVSAAVAAAPGAIMALKLAGGGWMVWLGLRAIRRAGQPLAMVAPGGAIFGRAFLIATLNVKSLLGYLAAFTQFVEPGRAIWPQMAVIVPTALPITAASYVGWTALGAHVGRRALDASRWLGWFSGLGFAGFGLVLMASAQ